MGDDSSLHEIDQERCDSGLNDVTAEHNHDRTLLAGRGGDRSNYRPKISRDQHLGKTRQKGCERPISSRRLGELLGPDFVRPELHGNRANG
jgi:hypothetical protein